MYASMFPKIFNVFLIMCILCFGISCNNQKSKPEIDKAFEILDEEAWNIFSTSAQMEVLDSGFIWTEGPLWLDKTGQLIFNDIPQNKTFAWTKEEGTTTYLSPSGYTNDETREGEPGANGLLLNGNGQLVLCQHGDRRMALMNSTIDSPTSTFSTIVNNYNGKRLNSPNDATYSKSGNLYFTDPPYGLANPALQEVAFNGVYRFSNTSELTVLDSTLTRPNGIAFSPDEKTLYVANSDPNRAIWMAYSIDDSTGQTKEGKVFYDATKNAKTEKGLPDGLKVNAQGYIFATGPGGVWVFNPTGKVIAKIRTGQATSNCAFGPNQNSLFITADDYIMRATF